jgi:hypothetical protein
MKLIIGNTGLVGKTICESNQFDHYFNTSNIDIFPSIAKDGDELFLCCLPATKWIVNKNIVADIENINKIISVISRVTYNKVTLISTIDVYNDSPLKSDETYSINVSKLNYGNNRYFFELMIREFIKTADLKIFRLPALFNKHIKKNIIYDLLYDNNIEMINSNSEFQWYNLDNLSNDIEKYSRKYPQETLFNLFTEPIETKDLIDLFPNSVDRIKSMSNRIKYDFTTKFNESGYISNKNDVLSEIKNLINEIGSK